MAVDPRLRDQDVTVRVTALGELFASREPDQERLEDAGNFLRDPNLNARRLAIEVFVMYGSEGVPYLVEGLDHSQPLYIRSAAAVGLGRLGAVGAPAIPALCKCLESDQEELRDRAGFALSRIDKEAVPSLQIMLQSSNPDAVLSSVKSLGLMSEDAEGAVGDLRSLAFASHSPVLRLACLSAIGQITGQASLVVPEILLMAEGADEEIVKVCIEKVTDLGGLAKDRSHDIIEFTRANSPGVRAAAAMGLAKIQADPTVSVPVLIALLEDIDEEVRQQVIMALACFGPAASEAVPVLSTVYKQGPEKLAGMAKAAIDQITRTPLNG